MFLHHYEMSPFSEKVRVLFGIKNASWRSVIQPVIMPKPDLTPLTGGYRRIPVLQIGADIYLDTPLIMAEIDARTPEPAAAGPLDPVVNAWTDRMFFQLTVVLVFASHGASTPRAFIEDREKLSGRAFDVDAMAAAAPFARVQWRVQAAWIEAALKRAPFLGGAAPGLSDAAAYMNVWWLSSAAPAEASALLEGFDRVLDWRQRLRAVGHGQRAEASPAEALAAARDAAPQAAPPHDPADPAGIAPGARVILSADDYGRDPILGRLVSASASQIVVAREDPSLGLLHVHAPRSGYALSLAKA
jgi:glutathione S-transferase